MKNLLLTLCICCLMVGCASTGELFTRGKYTETVCRKEKIKDKKKFYIFPVYKEVCEDVDKEGLHVVAKIKIKGTAAKFTFKPGEETGEGASFLPDFSGLQLKNQ